MRCLCLAVAAASLLPSSWLRAEPVAVRHAEGLVHGFLALRSLTGETLAGGELLQTSKGDQVTSELVFHFKDGSLHDETAVFSQTGHFRLWSYHLRQKGPSFPHPIDFDLDGKTGQSTVSHVDDDGTTRVENGRLEKVPLDLANGLVPILLKNVDAVGGSFVASMVVATPRPRLVTLHIALESEEPVLVGETSLKANRFVVKVELGGLTGVLAPLVGKQPPDTQVWMLAGPVPAFLKSEGPLYVGGPIWRIELTSPRWPKG